MSMTDPIADFLTRIRNGQSSGKTAINAPTSKERSVRRIDNGIDCNFLDVPWYDFNYQI